MLTKSVNGVAVECSPEEEAAIRAEWAENDPANKPVEKAAPTLEDKVNALLKASVHPELRALAIGD